MRVLVVDSFDSADDGHHLVGQVLDSLTNNGNEVDHLRLCTPAFDSFMTGPEWSAYETDSPLLAEETKDSAARVTSADALLFVYPTTMFGVSPRTKAWMERVLVPGVAFVFDEKQRVRPGLANVRRLGAVTCTPHGRRQTMRSRDLGRRMVLRTVRLNCSPTCRSTYVRLATGSPPGRTANQISRALRRWTD